MNITDYKKCTIYEYQWRPAGALPGYFHMGMGLQMFVYKHTCINVKPAT